MYGFYEENIQISICMIVKNEEKNLKRCLDSLLPIINVRDDNTNDRLCELLILDTGSTDRTRNIAFQYTEHVYSKQYIPWDFSAARNFIISKAKGKKILIVDADEMLDQNSVYWLQFVLLDKQFEKIPTTFVNIRNYFDRACTHSNDMLHPRIFNNDGKPLYECVVHNVPRTETPYYEAKNVLFHHYGYQWQNNNDLLKKKNDRTLPLLLEEYRKDPDGLHAVTHIIKSYNIVANYDKVIEFGEKWVTLMRTVDFHEGWFSYLESFTILIGAYLAKGDVENAERIFYEAHKYSKNIAEHYFMIGQAFAQTDEHKAADLLEQGVAISKKPKTMYERLLTTSVKYRLPWVYNWLAQYHMKNGDLEMAGDYLNEGIYSNSSNIPLRWDIWNESECKDKMKESLCLQE